MCPPCVCVGGVFRVFHTVVCMTSISRTSARGAGSAEMDNDDDGGGVDDRMRAARAIDSLALLIAGGAGLSADSGLPVYADAHALPVQDRDTGKHAGVRLRRTGCARKYAETQPHKG